MKVKENRIISPTSLRSLCIKYNWFTRGNNEEYEKLFQMIDEKDNLTTNDIEIIADYILQHSDTSDDLLDVCTKLANIFYTYFYY